MSVRIVEHTPPLPVDWDAWRTKRRDVLRIVAMVNRYELLAPLSRRSAAHEAEVRACESELAGTPYQPEWPVTNAVVVEDES